jgi:CheY-like chemotaxis protein
MKKVLFVDDDGGTLSAYSMAFSGSFEVATAKDGGEALSVLRGGFMADAVVSDISMPGMGGEDLVRTCAEEFPGLPVILVSGEDSVGETAERSGAAGWIMKPASLEDLREKVKEVCGPGFVRRSLGDDMSVAAAVYRRVLLGSGQSASRFPSPGSTPSAEDMAAHVLWALDEVDRLVSEGDESAARRHMDFVHGVLWAAGAFSLKEMGSVGST